MVTHDGSACTKPEEYHAKKKQQNKLHITEEISTRGKNTKYEIQSPIYLSATVINPKEYYIFVPYQTTQMSKNNYFNSDGQ